MDHFQERMEVSIGDEETRTIICEYIIEHSEVRPTLIRKETASYFLD